MNKFTFLKNTLFISVFFLLLFFTLSAFSQSQHSIGKVHYEDIPLETAVGDSLLSQSLAATGNRLFALQCLHNKMEICEYNFSTGKKIKSIAIFDILNKNAFFNSIFKTKPGYDKPNLAIVNNRLLLLFQLSKDEALGPGLFYRKAINFYIISDLELSSYRVGTFGTSYLDKTRIDQVNMENTVVSGVVGDTVLLNRGYPRNGVSQLNASEPWFLMYSYRVGPDSLIPLQGYFQIKPSDLKPIHQYAINETFLYPFHTQSWNEVKYLSDGYTFYSLQGENRKPEKLQQEVLNSISNRSCILWKDTLCLYRHDFDVSTLQVKKFGIHQYIQNKHVSEIPIKRANPEFKLMYNSTFKYYYSVEGLFFQAPFDPTRMFVRKFFFTEK